MVVRMVESKAAMRVAYWVEHWAAMTVGWKVDSKAAQ